MANQNINILANSIVLNPAITIWTGEAWASNDEIGVGEEIKPVLKAGRKKIFDPEKLSVFRTLKTSAFSLCRRYGVKFLGSYLVSNTELDRLIAKLSEYKVKWDAAMQDFLNDYEAECDRWVAQNPGAEEFLRSSMLSVNEIQRKFNFGWQTFTISPEPTGTVGDQTMDEIGEVPTRAMEKLADDIAKALPGYASAKKFSAVKLNNLADACRAVSFTSPEIGKLEEVLRGLAASGSSSVVRLVLGRLSDAREIAALCQPDDDVSDIISGIIVETSIDNLHKTEPTPVSEPAPAMPQEMYPIDVDALVAEASKLLGMDHPELSRAESVAEGVPWESTAPIVEVPVEAPVITPMPPRANAGMGMIDSCGLW